MKAWDVVDLTAWTHAFFAIIYHKAYRVKRKKLFLYTLLCGFQMKRKRTLSGEINYAGSIPAGVLLVEMFINSLMFCYKQIFD